MTNLPTQPLFEQLLADPTLDAAYEWHAETTHNPLDWAASKAELRDRLAAGEYAFSPLHRVHTPDGPIGHTEQWDETDRIVLKAMTLVLQAALGHKLSRNIYHLHGGAKPGVEKVHDFLAGSPDCWVMKSDVEGYYAHIDHAILYNQVAELIPGEKYLLRLVWQYLRHSVEDGGEYEDIEQGIARGCSLSPLMGALYLKPLDELLEAKGGCYVRFMDDWAALFPTRWTLRHAVAEANTVLEGLKLHKAADKTFIGRAAKGFDLLGYHFAPGADLAVSESSLKHRDERVARLYEQGAPAGRIESYLSRWQGWAQGGLHRPVVIPRPAPRSTALKRLAQFGVVAAAEMTSYPSIAAMLDLNRSVTASWWGGTLRSSNTAGGVFLRALGYFGATTSGYLRAGIMSAAIRNSGGGWSLLVGSPSTGSVAAAAGGYNGALLRNYISASSQSGVEVGLGSLSLDVFFSNGTGAGWATLSYSGATHISSISGFLNTSGGIVWGTNTPAGPTASVPEPSTLYSSLSLLAALMGLVSFRRRRSGQKAVSTPFAITA